MTIEKFHEAYWTGKYMVLNDHMYYRSLPSERPRYHDEKKMESFIQITV